MAECSCGPPKNQYWISSNPLTVRRWDVLFIRKRGDGGIEVMIRGHSNPVILQDKNDAKEFLNAFYGKEEKEKEQKEQKV